MVELRPYLSRISGSRTTAVDHRRTGSPDDLLHDQTLELSVLPWREPVLSANSAQLANGKHGASIPDT